MTPVRTVALLVTLVSVSTCATRAGSVDVSPVPPDFLVALKRGACLGACPSCEVAVGRDGVVTWDGYSDVRRLGRRVGHVRPETVAKLAAALARLQQLDLQDDYRFFFEPLIGQRIPHVTDMSVSWLTLRADGRLRTVTISTDEPRELTKFEDLVDRLAGTDRWK